MAANATLHRHTALARAAQPARVFTFAFTLALVLAAALAAFAAPARALAEEIDTNPTPNELQLEVERTAAALEEAQAQVAATQEDIEENNARIAELEELLPVQQARSDAAARELYLVQQESFGLLELLLSSQSLGDFLDNLEYVDRLTRANVEEIARTRAMKEELEGAQAQLADTLAQAEASEAEAAAALAAAQEARAEAQRRAEEAARQEAEQRAAAAAAAAAQEQERRRAEAQAGSGTQDAASQDAASQDAASSSGPGENAGDGGSGGAGSASAASDAAATQAEASTAAAELVSDGADWSSDQEAFVNEWAARIDAYLAGSPMAGQGRTFAVAAWNYGVDPRWSPAIAYTESSLGAACFLPYNAWGWGSESWGSWEEAIDAHVRGLARGYGYTISLENAKKYCPPNYQAWYERTLGQMNLI